MPCVIMQFNFLVLLSLKGFCLFFPSSPAIFCCGCVDILVEGHVLQWQVVKISVYIGGKVVPLLLLF